MDSRAAVPNLFCTRDQFCGRQFFHGPGRGDGSSGNASYGGDGSGGNASDGSGGNASDGGMVQVVMRVIGNNGEQWGAADDALLAHPLLTSCCEAQFLTGCGLVLVCDPGVGDPCSRGM